MEVSIGVIYMQLVIGVLMSYLIQIHVLKLECSSKTYRYWFEFNTQ